MKLFYAFNEIIYVTSLESERIWTAQAMKQPVMSYYIINYLLNACRSKSRHKNVFLTYVQGLFYTVSEKLIC